ncbi:MAG: hypothetical protein C0467_06790 [Planctomycetaceae bacterium]|nr:hypothetical protein [Planctomycetaceae bacterium]
MNTLDRADAYLTIPKEYAESLGGFWWSSRRDAVERRDGTTFAVADEIRAILTGVFAKQPVPPFAFVLNLLQLMKSGTGHFARLHEAFEDTRGAAARGRNVGLLIAELCDELPPVAGELSGQDVANALQCLRLYGEHTRPERVEEPALTRAEFEERILTRLAGFTDGDLRTWLTHGTGPSPAGKKLAAETESIPARVARLLKLARKRQRLVGAAVLVPALDAGLTLPPRRRAPNAPPQGGYCDVTTRGEPEQLLPTQFALDSDEFIRRFASRELLYFQKEEPHQPELPERVIVLDQGVRTWGSVRLALAAAAFSLLAPRANRCASVKLFLTSTHGPIDLTGQDVEAVADQLESSDLTPDPAACLVRAVHDLSTGPAPRDVILLTHPRSVRDMALSAKVIPRPSDRLFALTVDDRGKAELNEWHNGGVVAIRSFRVDLVAAEAARVENELPQPRHAPGTEGEWSGAVEPIPFPFRAGLVAEPYVFGFDADGEWLVIVGQNGILHGLLADGSLPEVLPRAFDGGAVLEQVDAVLGVTGGVVICGRMTPGREPAVASPNPATYSQRIAAQLSGAAARVQEQVAAHYDRATRRVTLHFLGVALTNARWSAYPDLHCITVRAETVTGCALDLGTAGRYPGWSDAGLVSRARLAWDCSAKGGTPPFSLPALTTTSIPEHPGVGLPYLRVEKNTFRVRHAEPAWAPACEPQCDGKPLLEGATIHRAQLAANVLALAVVRAGERKLYLLRGPDGGVLGEVAHPVRNAFTLSPDGRLLVRRDATRSVVVSETHDPGRPVATAPHAALHNALDIRLDAKPFRLTIAIGTFAHTFRLLNGELRYSLALGWDNFPEDKVPLTAQQRSCPQTEYDAGRFPASEGAASGPWRAVLDRLGQVLLFANGVLVAAFLVRRERAAAWIPGGVFWGTPTLIGGPATPDAEKKIGHAILTAGG